MRFHSVTGLMILFTLALGGCTKNGGNEADAAPKAQDTTEPAAPEAWSDDLSDKEKAAFMKATVLPKMKELFQGYNAQEFAEMNCGTCHGPGAAEGKFTMPNAALPPLNPADGFKVHQEKYPDMMTFMGSKVKPTMAGLLGYPPMSEENPKGFGCFACHTMAK